MSFLSKLEKIIIINENFFKNDSEIFCKKDSVEAIKKMHHIFNKSLLGLEYEFVSPVRIQLFKLMYSDSFKKLTAKDIYFEILKLDLSEERLRRNLLSWYEEQNFKVYFSFTEMENQNKDFDFMKFLKSPLVYLHIVVIIIFSIIFFNLINDKNSKNLEKNQISLMTISKILNSKTKEKALIEKIVSEQLALEESGVPGYLKYKDINRQLLKKYLNKRNSILIDEPYFSSIIESAKKHNLNPILLFAIAGQEQGFVPRDHPFSKKIANNPFNVYGSWEKYNTNIINSSEIAAGTVKKLLQNRPYQVDPFDCINKRYAEDSNWAKLVKILFEEIENYIS